MYTYTNLIQKPYSRNLPTPLISPNQTQNYTFKTLPNPNFNKSNPKTHIYCCSVGENSVCAPLRQVNSTEHRRSVSVIDPNSRNLHSSVAHGVVGLSNFAVYEVESGKFG
jgi:hypothetical protein